MLKLTVTSKESGPAVAVHRPLAASVEPHHVEGLDGVGPDSPLPSAGFLAVEDDEKGHPPDTHGAVGPRHLMAVAGEIVRIQTKTGIIVSTVGQQTFWARLFGFNVPALQGRVVYDTARARWIFIAVGPAGVPGAYPVDMGIALQFRKGRLAGWKQDWHLNRTPRF